MSKRKSAESSDRNKRRALISSSPPLLEMPEGYADFLADVKECITHERIRAVLSANAAMVLLYWDIGHSILDRQEQEGWGTKVIDRLALDLKTAFPDMSGLFPRNLKYMRKFAQAWPDRAIVQEALAQIPWYHNLALLEKADTPEVRLWNARKAVVNGWSRNILAMQIESSLHEREGQAQHNFPGDPAARRLGHGRAGLQGSLPLRFSRHR